MRENLYHILFAFIIFSCEPKQKEQLESKISFSVDVSSVIHEASNFHSECVDSTFTIKYESGEPRLTFKRSNGKIDSTLLEQYKSGLPKVRVNFENGKLKFGGHGNYYDSLLVYFYTTEDDTLRVETPIYKSYYHTNPNGELVYLRNYNSAGEPISSTGDLITHVKLVNIGDSSIFHFYLTNEPYFARYYDLQRRFFLSSMDGALDQHELAIDEETSAAFYKVSNIERENLELIGIAKFTDLVMEIETSQIMIDSLRLP